MIPSVQNLDNDSKLALEIAQKLAREENHVTFGAPHLMMALLNTRVGITSFLALMNKDLEYLRGWAQYRIDEYKSPGLPKDDPEADEKVRNILNVGKTFMLMFNKKRLDAICLMVALTRPEVGFPKGQMGSMRLTEDEFVQAVLNESNLESALSETSDTEVTSSAAPSYSPSATQDFLRFCIDKVAQAQQGKIDPIFGRDAEIRKLESTLCRRTKPNVIIIGEPGVGKTALVDGFALKIAEGNVSEYFKDAKLFQLDVGTLLAGASYRGEVEDRLKKILQEVKRLEKVILFIDEIHVILDSNSSANGIANLLKPELARGNLNVIGATTTKEYRLHIEKDPAFSRRFDMLTVEEPNVANAIKMVKGLKALFENHHKFTVADEVVVNIVKMAKRYFPQRQLPDSAIDLLDRAMASFRILEDNLPARLSKVKEELAAFDNDDTPKDWSAYWELVEGILSPLVLADIEHKLPTEGSGDDEWNEYMQKVLGELDKKTNQLRESLLEDDINAVVAVDTGIPLGKIKSGEQEKLLQLKDTLQAQVIGQDHAAEIIAKAILRNRSGLGEKGKPVGSFFLVGPTGTGKTELAKVITETLFNDKNNLIRFDMSEFMEKHTVSTLKGSPKGYVGYGDGGELVNKIRSKPYSVVLFDEIEKAHPEVLTILLQVLDEGHLHDTLGKKGTFQDAVILFTSNLESEWVVEQFNEGNIPEEKELRDRIIQSKSYHLKPEFFNRLDAIIPFSPLSREDLVHILELQLKRFLQPLREKNIEMELTQAAKEFLVDEGYSPAFGARPLKRTIDTYLGNKVSELIITGKLQEKSKYRVDFQENQLVFMPE